MSPKFFSSLFLNALNLLFVFSGNEASDPYLPLVMIQHGDQLYYPKELKSADLSEDQKSLSNVEFSLDNLHFNQIFFCPDDSLGRKTKINQANLSLASSEQFQKQYGISEIGESCLFKTEFERDQPVQCTVDADPVIYKVTEKIPEGIDSSVKCGPGDTGTLFQYVYELCPPNPNSFLNFLNPNFPFKYQRLKIYEICYDLNAKQNIYTKHELPIVGLLQNKNLKYEREKWYPLSIENFKYFGTNFQDDVEFYKKLAKRSTEDDEKIFDILARFIHRAQQLVPSLDMMSAILANPTFHYINVRPMHEKMTDLWTKIENTIRKNIDDVAKLPYQVYTGAFTISQDSKTTNIPDLWVKIVHMPKPEFTKWDFSLAIVMKNDNEYLEGDTFLDEFCEEDHCGLFKDLNVLFQKLLEQVRCCPVSKNIDDLFGSLGLHGNYILKIPNLTRMDPIPVTDRRGKNQISEIPETS